MRSEAAPGRQTGRCRSDAGVALVEYALLTALIALVAVGAIMYFQQATTSKLSTASTSIINAGN